MKKIITFSFIVAFFAFNSKILAQGSNCSTATPFCTAIGTPYQYPNDHSGSTAQTGPAYGCLCSEPNPGWFYLQASSNGNIVFSISQNSNTSGTGTTEDVDFVCWGPFTAATFATACSNLDGACQGGCSTTVNPPCSGGIADCSYSILTTEQCTIPAIAGDYYIIMVTNYSDDAGYITMTQTSGPATNCNVTCPGVDTPITLQMQDSANYALGNTTYVTSGSTLACNTDYYWLFNEAFTGTVNAYNSYELTGPCIAVTYSPQVTQTPNDENVVVLEGSSTAFQFCKTGCFSGQMPQAGEYLYELDSTQSHTFEFCGSGGGTHSTTVTISNCWTGAVLAGPQAMNVGSTTCYTLTVPAGADIGYAYYTITPTSGASGIYDYHDGYLYVDPNALPSATTFTVTYHFKGDNACPIGTGTFVFTSPTLPTVTVNSPTICAGVSTTLTSGGANTYTWSTSSTASSISVSPTTTTDYTVTGTNTATGCRNTATSTVTVDALPTVTSTSATVCNGVSASLTAGGASTYTWNTGSTTNPLVVSPASTTNYTVTGTSAAGCKNTATGVVTVNALPTVTSTSATICSGGSASLTAGGASTYTWNTGSSASPLVVSPASSTNYTVTGTNTATGCTNTAVGAVNVTPTPALSLSASSYTICNGSSQTFTASGASSYTWTPAATLNNANIASPAANPNVTTVYTVNGTASGCSPSSPLTLTLTVNPLPTYSLTSNAFTICNGSSQTFSVSGANTYTWTPAATLTGANTANPTANPTTTTVYNVTGTNANGCSNTTPATVTVTVNPKPTYSLSANSYTICNGSSQTFSVSGAASYTWIPAATLSNPNISNPVASPTTTTVYSVTGTNNNGCVNPIPATVTVTVNPIPTYSLADNSYTICTGSSQTFSVSGASTYTWTPSTTLNNANIANPTANPTITTVYSVTGTSASGCGNTITPATVTLTVNALPSINVVPSSAAICSGGGSSTLTATGASTYTWTPAATLNASTGSVVIATPTNTTTPTVYTVTGANANNCVNTNTVSITVNQTPTITVSGGGGNSQTICGGGVTNNTVSPINFSVTPAGSVSWTNSNAAIGIALSGTGNIAGYPAPSVTVQTIGIITANSTNANGCLSTANTDLTYTITINPIPSLTAPTITPAGCGLSDGTIIGAIGTGGSGGPYSYSWTGGAPFGPSSSYTNAAGTYPLQVKDNTTGCIYSQNFTLPNAGAAPPPTVTPSSTAACVGGTITLSAPPVVGMTYSWTESNGNTGSGNTYTVSNMPSAPNPYLITVTSTSVGCTGAAGTTSITVNPLPTPAISNSTSQICQGTSTSLSVTPTGSYSYQWGNGSGSIAGAINDTLSVTTSGTYSVSVTNTVTGCSASTSANGTITVNSLPIIDTSGVSISPSNCTSPTGAITNVSYTATPTATYVWTNSVTGTVVGGNSPSLNNVPAGNYCVQVTDGNGCVTKFCAIDVTNPGAPSLPSLVVFGNDTVYCQGISPQTLTVSVTSSGTVTPIVNWYNDPALTNTLAVNSTTYTPSGLPIGTTTLYVNATVSGCSSAGGRPITITMNPAPTPPTISGSVTNPLVECQGQTPTTVSLTTTATDTSIWYVGTGTVNVGHSYTPSTTFTGTTIYVISDSSTVTGCTNLIAGNALTVTVTINPSPTPPTISNGVPNPLVECQGITPATLSLTTTATDTAIWYIGANTVNVGHSYTPSTATPTTTIYVISDSSSVTGCTNLIAGNALTVTVTISSAPTPPTISNLVPNPLVECQGQTPTTVSLTTTATDTTIWYVVGTNTVNVGDSYTPSTTFTGTTIYVISDSSTVTGCTNLSAGNALTVTVTISPAPTITATVAGGNSAICSGSSAVIVPSGTGGVNSFTLTPGNQTGSSFTVSPTANTTYTISGSNPVTGCVNALANADTLTIMVSTTPTISIASVTNNTICAGDSSVITPTGAATYTLVPSNQIITGGSFTVSPNTTTTYTINGSNAAGCVNNTTTNVDTVTIQVSNPVASFTTNPSPAIGNAPLSVVFTNTSTNANTYVWAFGDTSHAQSNNVNTSFTYSNVGTYTVTLIASVNGSCPSIATTTVEVNIPTNIIIPNIFSPNGDGINDLFFIINTGMTSLNCQIFNRWGQLLYTITAPDQSWDGRTPNGDKAPEGTYMYILQAQGLDDKTYKQNGTLTLVR